MEQPDHPASLSDSNAASQSDEVFGTDSGEQRVLVLRDAIADFAAAELEKRDEEIVSLKKQLAVFQQKLEQQAAIDRRVNEISSRLEERQARRERDNNGITDGDFVQTMRMVIAQERESARKEIKAADEEAGSAYEAKLASFEQRIVQHTDQRIVQHVEQCSGRADALGEVMATERADRRKEVSAAIEEAQCAVEVKLAVLEERLKAVPGKLPIAKTWRPETVTYQAEFVSHDGALWQARKDTAETPGDADWVCVARAGRDGCDGRTPNLCGEYNARQTYAQLDVVAFDGTSFIACKDNPGICPGPGWQPLSRQGKPGRRGESITGPRGEKGEKGEPGASIASWQIDRERYRASPLMSNGTVGPMLELRGLFEQFLFETS